MGVGAGAAAMATVARAADAQQQVFEFLIFIASCMLLVFHGLLIYVVDV
jgi:hypothetical protein